MDATEQSRLLKIKNECRKADQERLRKLEAEQANRLRNYSISCVAGRKTAYQAMIIEATKHLPKVGRVS